MLFTSCFLPENAIPVWKTDEAFYDFWSIIFTLSRATIIYLVFNVGNCKWGVPRIQHLFKKLLYFKISFVLNAVIDELVKTAVIKSLSAHQQYPYIIGWAIPPSVNSPGIVIVPSQKHDEHYEMVHEIFTLRTFVTKHTSKFKNHRQRFYFIYLLIHVEKCD